MHRTNGGAGGGKWKGKDTKEKGRSSGKWVWRVKGKAMLTDQMSSLQLDSWSLPQEITFNIMSRLPVKSVMRCRCVCRAWRSSLKDPHFVDMHLDRVSQAKDRSLLLCSMHQSREWPIVIDYKVHHVEKILELGIVEQTMTRVEIPCIVWEVSGGEFPCTVWASCNGLLCSNSSCIDNGDMIIFNPFTREKVKLPRSNFGYDTNNTNCGWGYHSASKEYKALWFFVESAEDDTSDKNMAMVFTIGSNSWRSKGEVPFNIYGAQPLNVLVNEALHWVVEYPIDSDNIMVTAFDIGDEEFRYLSLPPELRISGRTQIKEFGEFLSLVDFSSSNCVEIWVMKHYGVGESWSKQYMIPTPEPVRSVHLIWPLEAGRVLLHYNQQFVSYDPLSNQTVPLAFQVPPNTIHTYVHLESLVSPRMSKIRQIL